MSDYISILMDEDDGDEEESSSFSPSVSSDNEALLSRLDALASARKAARLVALLRSMLQHGTIRLDSAMLPAFLVEEVQRKHAQEANAKAFSQWLNSLCIILADNAQEWLELNDIAIQCRTFRTLGTSQSSEAYQLCRKKRAYYFKALQRERGVALQQTNGNVEQAKIELWEHYSIDSEDVIKLEGSPLTPYGVWFSMCRALLHSALDARFFESLAQAEIISERAYKGSKCKYHTDVSGQAKSDYKRVIHNTGTNASAYDHMPVDAPVPVRMPPKTIRKLSKLKS